MKSQTRLQAVIKDFHFNLGYSGFYYLNGNAEEDLGDRKLLGMLFVSFIKAILDYSCCLFQFLNGLMTVLFLENRHAFWWFGHMYKHTQPHTLDLNGLEASIQQNRKFANVSNKICTVFR